MPQDSKKIKKIEEKILIHTSKENKKIKTQIKKLEKKLTNFETRFEDFTKFNKRRIDKLEKKIKKLEKKK